MNAPCVRCEASPNWCALVVRAARGQTRCAYEGRITESPYGLVVSPRDQTVCEAPHSVAIPSTLYVVRRGVKWLEGLCLAGRIREKVSKGNNIRDTPSVR